MKVLQRNCAAYLKLRNWQWWRLFTKVGLEGSAWHRDEQASCWPPAGLRPRGWHFALVSPNPELDPGCSCPVGSGGA